MYLDQKDWFSTSQQQEYILSSTSGFTTSLTNTDEFFLSPFPETVALVYPSDT